MSRAAPTAPKRNGTQPSYHYAPNWKVPTQRDPTGQTRAVVMSGLLTNIGWRWPLLLPGPVALIVLLAALKFVPNDGRPARDGRGFDIGGAVTSTSAMLLLVYTIVQAPEIGWLSPMTIGTAVLAIALLGALTEQPGRNPITGTHRTGSCQPHATTRVKSGEAEQS